jgi:hypothetical protein
LHSVFYIEDKDSISEDLLVDFKNDDDQTKFVQTSNLASKKNKASKEEAKQKVIQMDRGKNTITENDLMFGPENKYRKNTVDI